MSKTNKNIAQKLVFVRVIKLYCCMKSFSIDKHPTSPSTKCFIFRVSSYGYVLFHRSVPPLILCAVIVPTRNFDFSGRPHLETESIIECSHSSDKAQLHSSSKIHRYKRNSLYLNRPLQSLTFSVLSAPCLTFHWNSRYRWPHFT